MSIFSLFSSAENKWKVLSKGIKAGQEELDNDFLSKARFLSIDHQWLLVSDVWPKIRGNAREQLVSAIWEESFYFLFHYTERGSDKRYLAIEILGYLHNEIVAEYLLKLMRDKDDNIKLAASGSMASQPFHIAMPLLIDALKRPHVYVPARIGQAILAFGKSGIEEIVASYSQVDVQVQGSIIDLLAEAKEVARPEILLRALESDDPNIRSKAILAVQNLELISLLPKLTQLLNDDVAKVRGLAAQALGLIGKKKDIEDLVPLMNDEDQRVQVWATEAIRLLQKS